MTKPLEPGSEANGTGHADVKPEGRRAWNAPTLRRLATSDAEMGGGLEADDTEVPS